MQGYVLATLFHELIMTAAHNLGVMTKRHKYHASILHFAQGTQSEWCFLGNIAHNPLVQTLLRFEMSGFLISSMKMEDAHMTPHICTFHEQCHEFLTNYPEDDAMCVRKYDCLIDMESDMEHPHPRWAIGIGVRLRIPTLTRTFS
jgi:hypothetical protein